MEFLEKNFLLDSTTDIQATEMTGSAASLYNVMDRDPRFTAYSVSAVDGNNWVYLALFSSGTAYRTIDRVAVVGHNFKKFEVQYVDLSLGWLPFTTTLGAGTTSSEWITNSLTSHYLRVTPVQAAGVRVQAWETMVANDSKELAYFYIGALSYRPTQSPSYAGLKVLVKDKTTSHVMSNGGRRELTLAQKYSTVAKMDYITSAIKSSLYSFYFNRNPFTFVASPPTLTAASWDQVIYPAVWSNGFDFETYSDNSSTPYFSGTMIIDEVSK